LAEATPEWQPLEPHQAPPRPALTDLGNAERLVQRHGQDLRYCYPWGAWLFWDERRWKQDDCGEAERRAQDTARSIYQEAAAEDDPDRRAALADHARKTESEHRRRAMLASARCLLPVQMGDLDSDPWAFNVLNGTLDLRTGKLRPHRREDFITKLAPVHYDPDAEAPTWWKFLNRIFDRNLELMTFLQKAVGYSMTGHTWEQVLFILYGLGANGKSTFLETIRELLGDYARETTSETFLVKTGQTASNDLAALRGARFVKATETDSGKHLAEALVKQITGGDTITARFLYQEFFSFRPQFKIFISANHKPLIRGTDWAIWRRIRLIPFTVQIPPQEQDKRLPEKLRAELSGILNWALEGCLLWQNEGLEPPAEVQAATAEYQAEMDLLGDWLSECCILANGASALAGELYQSYTEWCERTGEKRPLSRKAFGALLRERGLESGKSTAGARIWLGIGLKPV